MTNVLLTRLLYLAADTTKSSKVHLQVCKNMFNLMNVCPTKEKCLRVGLNRTSLKKVVPLAR